MTPADLTAARELAQRIKALATTYQPVCLNGEVVGSQAQIDMRILDDAALLTRLADEVERLERIIQARESHALAAMKEQSNG